MRGQLFPFGEMRQASWNRMCLIWFIRKGAKNGVCKGENSLY